MPAHLPDGTVLGILNVRVLGAQNLAVKDIAGKSDPYCVLELNDQREETKVVYNNLDPVWDEEFHFNVTDWSDRIEFVLWDKDFAKSPDFLGRLSLPVSKYRDVKHDKKGTWYELQRMPGRESERVTGELFLALTFEASEQLRDFESRQRHKSSSRPSRLAIDSSDDYSSDDYSDDHRRSDSRRHDKGHKDSSHRHRRSSSSSGSQSQRPRPLTKGASVAEALRQTSAHRDASGVQKYGEMSIDIVKGRNLAKKDTFGGSSDPFVEVRLGANNYHKTAVVKNNLNPEWNDHTGFTVESASDELILTVWDHDRIGSKDFMGEVRLPMDKLKLDQANEGWFTLEQSPDRKGTDKISGDIYLVIKFLATDSTGHVVSARSGGGSSSRRHGHDDRHSHKPAAKLEPGILHVDFVRARNLPKMDTFGLSDPFIIATLGSETYQTKVVKKSLDPEWDESHQFRVSEPASAELAVVLYDKDTMGKDFMGQIVVPITNLRPGELFEDWYALHPREGKKDKVSGDIFLRCKYVNDRKGSLSSESDRYGRKKKTSSSSSPVPKSGTMHVTVVSARDLAKMDTFGSSDPFCELHIGDSTERAKTTVKKNTLSPTWNESFPLPVVDRTSESLVVVMSDKDTFSSDFMGQVTVPLGAYKPGQPKKQEFALEKRSDKDKVQGFLTLEIVFAPDESDIGAGKVDDTGRGDSVLAAGGGRARPRQGTMHVKVTKARDLPKTDTFGSCDPFVILTMGEQKEQTKVVQKSLSPDFEEHFQFRCKDNSEQLKVTVMDKDLMSTEFVGEVVVTLADIGDNEMESRWYQLQKKNGKGDAKGEIFLEIAFRADGKAAKGSLFQRKKAAHQSQRGTLHIQVIEGRNLAKKDSFGTSDPFVEIKIGDQKFKTKVKKKTLNPTWDERFQAEVDRRSDPILVSVWDSDLFGSDFMGFFRFDQDVLEDNVPIEDWLPLGHDDKHVDDTVSGDVRVRVVFVPEEAAGDKLFRPTKGGAVRVEIVKAEGLADMDVVGLSDPFVEVAVGGKKEKTKTIPDDLNPVWDESFDFPLDETVDGIRLTVWDEDSFGNDFMGEAEIPLAKLRTDQDLADWFDLRGRGRDKAKGRVFVRIKLLNADEALLLSAKKGPRPIGSAAGGAGKHGDGSDEDEDFDTLARKKGWGSRKRKAKYGTLKVVVARAKDLANKDGFFGGKSDPFVVLSFGSNTAQTRVVEDELNPVWDQDFYFKVPDLSGEVVARVWDKDPVDSDFLGEFRAPLGDLIDGTPLKRWFKLHARQNKKDKDIRGAVELEMLFTADELESDAEDDGDGKGARARMHGALDVGTLTVEILEGRHLAKKDLFKTSDPFAVVSVGSRQVRSRTIQNSLSPKWMEKFQFTSVDRKEALKVQVWDFDKVSKSDFMGVHSIPVSSLGDGREVDMWYRLQPRAGHKEDKVSGEIHLRMLFVADVPEDSHGGVMRRSAVIPGRSTRSPMRAGIRSLQGRQLTPSAPRSPSKQLLLSRSVGPGGAGGGAGVEKEVLYDELLAAKRQIKELNTEKTKLKSTVRRQEEQIIKAEKVLEGVLLSKGELDGTNRANTLRNENQLVKGLKTKNAALEHALKSNRAEMERIKRESKYARIAELEQDVNAYYMENRRLQKLVEGRYDNSNEQQSERKVSELEAENEHLQRQVAEYKKLVRGMKTDTRSAQSKLADKEKEASAQSEKLNRQARKAKEKLRALEHELQDYSPADLLAALEKYRDKIKGLQAELADKNKLEYEYDKLRKEYRNVHGSSQQASSELEELRKMLKVERSVNAKLSDDNDKLQETFDMLEGKVHHVQDQARKTDQHVQQFRRKADEAGKTGKSEVMRMEATLEQQREKILELQAEVDRLRRRSRDHDKYADKSDRSSRDHRDRDRSSRDHRDRSSRDHRDRDHDRSSRDRSSRDRDYDRSSRDRDYDRSSRDRDYDRSSRDRDYDRSSRDRDYDRSSRDRDYDRSSRERDYDRSSRDRDYDRSSRDRDYDRSSRHHDDRYGREHHDAAVKVQAMYRGYQVRKSQPSTTSSSTRYRSSSSSSRPRSSGRPKSASKPPTPSSKSGRKSASSRTTSYDRPWLQDKKKSKSKQQLETREQEQAATKVQAAYRGYRDRQKVKSLHRSASRGSDLQIVSTSMSRPSSDRHHDSSRRSSRDRDRDRDSRRDSRDRAASSSRSRGSSFRKDSSRDRDRDRTRSSSGRDHRSSSSSRPHPGSTQVQRDTKTLSKYETVPITDTENDYSSDPMRRGYQTATSSGTDTRKPVASGSRFTFDDDLDGLSGDSDYEIVH